MKRRMQKRIPHISQQLPPDLQAARKSQNSKRIITASFCKDCAHFVGEDDDIYKPACHARPALWNIIPP